MATEETTLLSGDGPAASFGRTLESPPFSSSSSSSSFPQTIAHRGYKAAFPENSMAAFRGAVACGAHAVETDLHLSRDGVVVLAHDPSLRRCFGVDRRLADCDWDYLRTLRSKPLLPRTTTITTTTTAAGGQQQPRGEGEGLARLRDLLEYLGAAENERIWVLLDIKMDDDAEDLLTKTAETLASVPTTRPWRERVMLGGWNANYINHCHRLLPGYPVACIAFTPLYAWRFLHGAEFAHVDFTVGQQSLVGPVGARFRAGARRAGRSLFVWTVNDEEWMEWCVRKRVDGVITDDPRLFLDVCRRAAGDNNNDSEEGEKMANNNNNNNSNNNNSNSALVVGTRRRPRSVLRTAGLYLGAFVRQVLLCFLLLCYSRALSRKGASKMPREKRGSVGGGV